MVDLGYGATPATAVELFERLSAVRPDVRVVGIEIEPERVRLAMPLERPGLSFQVGGFELPVPAGRSWCGRSTCCGSTRKRTSRHLAAGPGPAGPDGLFIDGTCDEIGRRVTWVALDAERPLTLSMSMRFGSLRCPRRWPSGCRRPSSTGTSRRERIHAFLQAMDQAWLEAAPLASFGNRQRWTAMCRSLLDAGWPVQDGRPGGGWAN